MQHLMFFTLMFILVFNIGLLQANQTSMDTDKTATESTKSIKTYQPKKALPRGQLLYQNHCRVCHDSRVHIRENHRVKSAQDIRYWVNRWSAHLKLNWNQDEISAVVDYLSHSYYKFSATP